MSTIEWKVEVNKGQLDKIVRDFDKVDEAIFKDQSVMNPLWQKVFNKIASFIKKRFEEGKGSFKPLSPRYLKWKTAAVANGKTVNVGQFGRRVCAMNQIGRLTDTMYNSATEKDVFANIFETKTSGNISSFRYAISGERLPYAIYFDKKRPFFFLYDKEADQVFDIIEKGIFKRIDDIWK